MSTFIMKIERMHYKKSHASVYFFSLTNLNHSIVYFVILPIHNLVDMRFVLDVLRTEILYDFKH